MSCISLLPFLLSLLESSSGQQCAGQKIYRNTYSHMNTYVYVHIYIYLWITTTSPWLHHKWWLHRGKHPKIIQDHLTGGWWNWVVIPVIWEWAKATMEDWTSATQTCWSMVDEQSHSHGPSSCSNMVGWNMEHQEGHTWNLEQPQENRKKTWTTGWCSRLGNRPCEVHIFTGRLGPSWEVIHQNRGCRPW